MTMQLSIGLNIALLGPARSAPAAPGNAQRVALQAFSRDRTIFDSGAARGIDAVAIPLTINSVDAPDGSEIEVRFVRADNSGEVYPWRTLGTLSGGTLSAPYFQPTGARSVHWLIPEVRVVNSSETAQGGNSCGVGHVWALWEQSNYARIFFNNYGSEDQFSDFISGGAYEGDLQVCGRTTGGANDDIDPDDYEVRQVTAANYGFEGTYRSPAVIDLANAWSSERPGEKLMIIFQTKSGTGPNAALSTQNRAGSENESGDYGDSASGRDWAVDKAIHDKATEDGQQVGLLTIPGWYESGGGQQLSSRLMFEWFTGRIFEDESNYITLGTTGGKDLPRIFISHRADGSPNDGSGNPYFRDGFPSDNDSLEAPYTGGIYDLRYTKICYLGTHEEMGNDTLGAGNSYMLAANVTADHLDYVARGDGTRSGYRTAVDLFDSSRFPEVLDFPGVTTGALFAWNDLLHTTGGDADGRQRLAKIWLYMTMHAAGLHSYGVPSFDRRWDAPDGSYADIWVDGADVETDRRLRGLPALKDVTDPEYGNTNLTAGTDHRTEVMGIAINKRPAHRAEIHTIDQVGADSGHDAPDGTKVVRVWPNAGTFDWTTLIEQPVDPRPGIFIKEDVDEKAILNRAVGIMGQPDEMLPGIPVQPSAPVTNRAVPDLMYVDDSLWRAGGGVQTTHTKMVMRIQFRPDAISVQITPLISIASNYRLRMNTNAVIDITGEGGESVVSSSNYARIGVWMDLRLVVDRDNGIFELYDGDTLLGDDNANAVSDGTPFGAGQLNFFDLGGNTLGKLRGLCTVCAFWFGQTDTSGNPDFGFVADSTGPQYLDSDGVTVGAEAGATLIYGAEVEDFDGVNPITAGSPLN